MGLLLVAVSATRGLHLRVSLSRSPGLVAVVVPEQVSKSKSVARCVSHCAFDRSVGQLIVVALALTLHKKS